MHSECLQEWGSAMFSLEPREGGREGGREERLLTITYRHYTVVLQYTIHSESPEECVHIYTA